MFNSNVAPRRRVRLEKRKPWTCKCGPQPAAIKRCNDCLERRP